MEQCSETSAYKIQKPGNCPEERIQHSEHGESLKSRKVQYVLLDLQAPWWPDSRHWMSTAPGSCTVQKLHCPEGATHSHNIFSGCRHFTLRHTTVSSFTMKMQAAVSTQMSANLYKTTAPHLQENCTLPNHGHENAKYCKFGDISSTSNVAAASTHTNKAHMKCRHSSTHS